MRMSFKTILLTVIWVINYSIIGHNTINIMQQTKLLSSQFMFSYILSRATRETVQCDFAAFEVRHPVDHPPVGTRARRKLSD